MKSQSPEMKSIIAYIVSKARFSSLLKYLSDRTIDMMLSVLTLEKNNRGERAIEQEQKAAIQKDVIGQIKDLAATADLKVETIVNLQTGRVVRSSGPVGKSLGASRTEKNIDPFRHFVADIEWRFVFWDGSRHIPLAFKEAGFSRDLSDKEKERFLSDRLMVLKTSFSKKVLKHKFTQPPDAFEQRLKEWNPGDSIEKKARAKFKKFAAKNTSKGKL